FDGDRLSRGAAGAARARVAQVGQDARLGRAEARAGRALVRPAVAGSTGRAVRSARTARSFVSAGPSPGRTGPFSDRSSDRNETRTPRSAARRRVHGQGPLERLGTGPSLLRPSVPDPPQAHLRSRHAAAASDGRA